MSKPIEKWIKDLEQLITLTIGQVFTITELEFPVQEAIYRYYDDNLDSVIVAQRIFNILLESYRKDRCCTHQFESIN